MDDNTQCLRCGSNKVGNEEYCYMCKSELGITDDDSILEYKKTKMIQDSIVGGLPFSNTGDIDIKTSGGAGGSGILNDLLSQGYHDSYDDGIGSSYDVIKKSKQIDRKIIEKKIDLEKPFTGD